MAIKMRHNKDEDAVCGECGDKADQVLNMFDICVAGEMLTLCDVCNAALLRKTLSGDCITNSRLKTQKDLLIMKKRSNKKGYAMIPINEGPKKW